MTVRYAPLRRRNSSRERLKSVAGAALAFAFFMLFDYIVMFSLTYPTLVAGDASWRYMGFAHPRGLLVPWSLLRSSGEDMFPLAAKAAVPAALLLMAIAYISIRRRQHRMLQTHGQP